jgi:secreted Zn-dependent insulinase-like peptidase
MNKGVIDQMKDDLATFGKLNQILLDNWEDDSAKVFQSQMIDKMNQICMKYGQMAEDKLTRLEKIAEQLENYAEQLRKGAIKKTLYVRGRAYQNGQNWISGFSYQTTCDQFVNTTDNASIVAIVKAEHPDWKEIVVTFAEKSSDLVDI